MYNLLRYLAQGALIYLLLRIFLNDKLSTVQSLILAIMILVFWIITEISVITTFKNGDFINYFSGNTCSKQIVTPNVENGSCRVVCDSKEDFGNVSSKNEQNASAPVSPPQQGSPVITPAFTPAPMPDIVEPGVTGDSPNSEVQNSEVQNGTVLIGDNTQVDDNRYYWGQQLVRNGNLGYDPKYGYGGAYYEEPSDRTPGNTTKTENQILVDDITLENRKQNVLRHATNSNNYDSRYQEVGPKSEKLKTLANRRRIEGDLDDELPYSDYNHLPVGTGYRSHDYEYGYSYLPPEKWYPLPPRPPICVTDKRCPVCPVYADGAPTDVKEFYTSRRIMPPDLINTDYIDEKLNAGR